MSEYIDKLLNDIQQALDDKDYVKLARLAEQAALLKRDIPGKR